MSSDSGNQKTPAKVWQEGQDISDYFSDITGELPDMNSHLRISVEGRKSSGLFRGKILSGDVGAGDPVVLVPSALRTTIRSVHNKSEFALEDDFEVSIGEMVCCADNPVESADQFETSIYWISQEPMMAGRPYEFCSTSNRVDGSITAIKYAIQSDSDDHIAINRLEQNTIGVCNISLSRRVPFEPYKIAGESSQIRIFDKETNELSGIGVIHFALRRASNVHWQALDVTRDTRAKLKGQRPAILWFTGLSGSGKSAIANILEKKLTAIGRHTYTLDGDNVRHGLNRDLGFTDVDRVENIRRIGEVARLMADSGLIILVSFISPFKSERQLARGLAHEGEFIEIHVDTPLEVAESRDIKGLYKKARSGEIKNFTGIDSPYEAPEKPDIRVDTVKTSADDAAEHILDKLQAWGMID